VTVDEAGQPCLTPDQVREAVARIRADRVGGGVPGDAAFVVGIHGETPGPGPDGAEIVRPWVEAGATWWLELIHGWRGSTDHLFARVAAGPPRG
jgi:hypothetical protein